MEKIVVGIFEFSEWRWCSVGDDDVREHAMAKVESIKFNGED